ncbi:MAG: imidazole glycerol phosphate synthase subunit HisH [Chlorobium sp.]
MSIGIVDIGIGNIGSLRGALYSQGWDTKTVTLAADLDNITHLFLPGVGSFAVAMQRLHIAGLVDPIKQYAAKGRPLMGICLGMQLFADMGIEGGESEGLGLISGNVALLETDQQLRLPHVGWNVLHLQQKHPLLQGIRTDVDYYFVHSYYFNAMCEVDIVGITEYGINYPSFIARGSVVGVQFHPEKSQRNGLRLLENFCLWSGVC